MGIRRCDEIGCSMHVSRRMQLRGAELAAAAYTLSSECCSRITSCCASCCGGYRCALVACAALRRSAWWALPKHDADVPLDQLHALTMLAELPSCLQCIQIKTIGIA